MLELKDEGLTYPKIREKLNEEFVAKGFDEISISWVKTTLHRLRKRNEV
jgi:hypothetical protein